nr:serine proteinase stubble-like [Penaeus vannamei]
MLGGNLEGPGGAGDRPHALPLDRNPRTTPQRRRDGNGLSRATKRLFLGDQSLCYSGSCEFFLFCWLGGGLIDGGCGGFLFACCSRPNNRGQRGHESYRDDKTGFVPIDYGPIRNDRDCGLSASSRLSAQRRIVGGTEAGFGSFPWTAYIRIGSSRCGGSLINQYHVVTAGHCVARARAHQIRVTLGDYILNSDKEHFNPRIYGASEIKVHPNFKFTPQADRFDVAVITLDAPVAYEPHIQPICLPEKGTDWLGSIAWAAGWGALQAGSKLRPKTLQVVDVPILDSRLCEDWHRQRGINVIIHDEMMCAGYNQGGKDSCQGDSGGPLMIQDGGRWYLAGIVSAGYSCAQSKQPGIYHKVSYTSDWISYAARS